MSDISLSIVETIGQTPLLALDRLGEGLPGRVLLKLEYFNPGHSIKDRIARQIIEDAERDGQLRAGQTVIELTSGNTGTGLAVVCAAKGYSLVCVMSEGNSIERARMMRALGARVVLIPQIGEKRPGKVSGEDLAAVEVATQKLSKQLDAFRADQFYNAANARAHEEHTGPEIWRQSSGKVDAFVSIAGSGGSFGGISQFLKNRNPAICCYLAEPVGAAFLAEKEITDPSHQIQGTGYMMELPLVPRENIDRFLQVTDEEAIETARLLAKTEGVFGGFSTGANVAAALKLAREAEQGDVVVTLASDSGMKYLSTELYSDTKNFP